MKYMLQIYGNITREQFAAMSEEQQKQLYADWGAINQTPGVTPAPSSSTTRRRRRRSAWKTARRS